MNLSRKVLDKLDQGVSHVAPLEPTLPDYIAYVLIFGRKTPSERPRYHVIWVEMSNRRYQAYKRGNDIGWDDAEHIEEQWANNPEELEQILASRVPDFSQIITTRLSKISYPR